MPICILLLLQKGDDPVPQSTGVACSCSWLQQLLWSNVVMFQDCLVARQLQETLALTDLTSRGPRTGDGIACPHPKKPKLLDSR
jgi:hypothetical protein